MNDGSSTEATVLLTGATGFVGQYILSELLRRGQRIIAVVRPETYGNPSYLLKPLSELGLNGARLLNSGVLKIVPAHLPDDLSALNQVQFSQIVHCAGQICLAETAAGDVERTNVQGTAALCRLALARHCRAFHQISTAYICGRDAVGEQPEVGVGGQRFGNAYEASKQRAECEVRRLATGSDMTVTVYRPGIVVGHSRTGRATRFQGFYLLARATELLKRLAVQHDEIDPHAVALRIRGSAQNCQNLVPVDYVAHMVAGIVCCPQRHGRIYHLTHPRPPTNTQIKSYLERYYDLAGGRFVPQEVELNDLSRAEEVFYGMSQPIGEYFTNTPVFSRRNTREVERQLGVNCPLIDYAMVKRWLEYAAQHHWGRRSSNFAHELRDCQAYFEKFLPAYVPRSAIARMTALTTSVRFSIEGAGLYECTCFFREGRLDSVRAGPNGHAAYGYRTTYPVFLDAIAGRRKPQGLFLSHEAEIEGDVEKGLKMAMILHEFTKEFPCDMNALQQLS